MVILPNVCLLPGGLSALSSSVAFVKVRTLQVLQ